MNRYKNSLIGGVLCAVFAVIGMFMSSRDAVAQNPHPGAAPVNIVSPLPLPVTGSATVSGTVAATQSGAWSIGMTHDEENPARHAIKLGGIIPPSPPDSANNVTLGTVPAGVRYVIEQYFLHCDVDQIGTLTNVYLLAGGSQDAVVPHFVQSNGFANGQAVNAWVGSAQTRLYADPGEHISVGRSGHGANVEGCSGSISGYSVALP